MKNAVHFVGFKGDEFSRAKGAFGPPDFIHRIWDARAASMIAPYDTVVFAAGTQLDIPNKWSFDDLEHF